MRRTIGTTALAWSVGFCMAAAVASAATTRLNAWRAFGEYFQLGYVVGYLDAVKLAYANDSRVMLPTSGMADFERWRTLVNEYFADPKNANRVVPDAMAEAGKVISAEAIQRLRERNAQAAISPSPSPSSASGAPAAHP
jgi:hypothetical protein